jgi:hypothetical protein
MSAFDIEKARAGEPVEYRGAGSRWVAVHFVGLSMDGSPTIQTGVRTIFSCYESELRMAPKKVKVRYRVGIFSELGDTWPAVTNSDRTAALWEKTDSFKGWLTEWKETEVEL